MTQTQTIQHIGLDGKTTKRVYRCTCCQRLFTYAQATKGKRWFNCPCNGAIELRLDLRQVGF